MNDSFTFPPLNTSYKPLKLTDLAAHDDPISCVGIGRWSSSLVATGGEDCVVKCWKVGRLQPHMAGSGHTSPIDSVCFDAREDLLAAGSRSGSIRIWDVPTGRDRRPMGSHRSAVTALDFHPFGDYFASGSTDTNVKLWDIKRRGCMQTYKGHEAPITKVVFSPDGRWVVSGDASGAVRVWDVTAGKLVHEIRSRREPVVSFHFHPNELLLATAYTHNIALHDLDHFSLLSTTPREASTIRYAMFDPDGLALISVQPDHCRTWTNWDSPQCHDGCEGRWEGAYDVSISANKELVVASRAKNQLRVHLVDLWKLAPFKRRNDQENVLPTGAAELSRGLAQTRSGKDEWANGKADHLMPGQLSPSPAALPPTPPPAPPASVHTSFSSNASAASSNDSLLSVSPKPSKPSILASPNAAFFRAHATASPVAVPPQQQQQPQQPQQHHQHQHQQQPAAQQAQPAAVMGWPVAAAGRITAQAEQKAPSQSAIDPRLLTPVSSHSAASNDTSRHFATPKSVISPALAPIAAAPAAPIAAPPLIPSQPTHPLNLSFSSFLPPVPAPLPLPVPSLDSDALRDRLLEQHDLTLRALAHRRQNLNTLVALWCTPPSAGSSATAAIRTLCATLAGLNDQLVAADFLQSTYPQFSSQPLLTLECALLLLPLLRAMLASKYERCVLTALRYVQLVVDGFGQLVRDGRRAGGGGVDVVGEERRARCDGVWRELHSVWSGVGGLKGSSDVGQLARQLKLALQDVVEE